MTIETAAEIATLLNEQNQLETDYTPQKIIENQDDYIFKLDENSKAVGVVKCRRVQWYQWEISHLSAGMKRNGVGSLLLAKATEKAESLGARILQCTIRIGNTESEAFFKKHGFIPSISFLNSRSENRVTVFQKLITP